MFVAERVEYEAFFGNKGVTVRRNPISCGRRTKAPRYQSKLILKKAIAHMHRSKSSQIHNKNSLKKAKTLSTIIANF